MAVSAVRRLRGNAQSQLMLCADEQLWVVKFLNNPQHPRVLANELVATRIGEAIGLTVPSTEVIEVSEELVANTPSLEMELPRNLRVRCLPGLHFGSRLVEVPMPGQVVDYVTDAELGCVCNLDEFAGVLVLDKWTANCDGRQAVFSRNYRERCYRATFIDQGFCFNAGEWNFPDITLRGTFARRQVYAAVTGWDSFEPWLSRLEVLDPETLWRITEAVPGIWYGGNRTLLARLASSYFFAARA